MNPIASFNIPEDPVPAAQDRLKELIKSRQDAQIALQHRIKPLNVPRTFVSGDKVWLSPEGLREIDIDERIVKDVVENVASKRHTLPLVSISLADKSSHQPPHFGVHMPHARMYQKSTFTCLYSSSTAWTSNAEDDGTVFRNFIRESR
jgi:hypothetical protein